MRAVNKTFLVKQPGVIAIQSIMISVGICGSLSGAKRLLHSQRTTSLNEVSVRTCLVETPRPIFDPQAPAFNSSVLLRVRAFSCNYRDLDIITYIAERCSEDFDESYGFFGSEFVAEVEAVGKAVEVLKVGDRVIGDNEYPSRRDPMVAPGIPTNHASKRFRILPAAKLLRIPRTMPDEVAASLSIGAQTAYGMLKKLQDPPTSDILVTAARSNTSIFAIGALRRRGFKVYALTSSRGHENRLRWAGATEVVQIESGMAFNYHEQISSVVSRGGFGAVVDPFFDAYISSALEVIAVGGSYLTCGRSPRSRAISGGSTVASLVTLFDRVFGANLHIVGSCLGGSSDLTNAIQDYDNGSLNVVVDSVFDGVAVDEFLSRTYNDPRRFGKVVYRYEADA